MSIFFVLLLCPGWEKKNCEWNGKIYLGFGRCIMSVRFLSKQTSPTTKYLSFFNAYTFLFFVPFFFCCFFLFVKLFSLFFAAKFQTRLTITLLIPFHICFMFYMNWACAILFSVFFLCMRLNCNFFFIFKGICLSFPRIFIFIFSKSWKFNCYMTFKTLESFLPENTFTEFCVIYRRVLNLNAPKKKSFWSYV